jgi:hypothetical protein
MRFINEDDQALLMVGSSDGMIKVYRNYESDQHMELVSAFRALNDMNPCAPQAGLSFEWLQGRGRLIVGGDMRVIKVWNALTELCLTVSFSAFELFHLRVLFIFEPLLTPLGNPCSFRCLHYIFDFGASSWRYLCRWVQRWCRSSLRSTSPSSRDHGSSMERPQVLDHQRPYAKRRPTRTYLG